MRPNTSSTQHDQQGQGIYGFIGRREPDAFNPILLLPGLPHLLCGKLRMKGILMLLAGFSSLWYVIAFIILPGWGISLINNAARQQLIAPELFSTEDLTYRLLSTLSLALLWVYLIQENKFDLELSFQNCELDHQPKVLAASVSGSYMLALSIFIGMLLFISVVGLPQKEERTIELEVIPFVDNPLQKSEPKTPADVKRVAVQNALDSGKFNKEIPVSPTQSAPTAPPQPKPSPKTTNDPPPVRSSPYSNPNTSQVPTAIPSAKPKLIAQNDGNIADKPLLPNFKPQANERPILTSGETQEKISESNSAKGGGEPVQISSASIPSSVGGSGRTPVLNANPSGSFSTGTGLNNAAQNNNPNGPATVAARKDIDYGPYMQDLQSKIQRAWSPPQNLKQEEVVIRFKLTSAGGLIPGSLSTISTSNPEAEQAASKAILAAAPSFRPLPAGAPPQVTIDFTFTKSGLRIGKKY